MSLRLKTAVAARQTADREVENALHADYPPGAPIAWEGTKRLCHGTVVMNCYGDRVKVRNAATGSELFIEARRVK